MGITKAPGDRSADTPEWLCITNQRINPFKHRNEEVIPRALRKEYSPVSLTPGYLCTNEILTKYHVSRQTLRKWNRTGHARTFRQKHATMYFEADIQRMIEQRRTA